MRHREREEKKLVVVAAIGLKSEEKIAIEEGQSCEVGISYAAAACHVIEVFCATWTIVNISFGRFFGCLHQFTL